MPQKGKHMRKIPIIALIGALMMLSLGIWREEASVVFNKGINICLECVGIG